VAWSLL